MDWLPVVVACLVCGVLARPPAHSRSPQWPAPMTSLVEDHETSPVTTDRRSRVRRRRWGLLRASSAPQISRPETPVPVPAAIPTRPAPIPARPAPSHPYELHADKNEDLYKTLRAPAGLGLYHDTGSTTRALRDGHTTAWALPLSNSTNKLTPLILSSEATNAPTR
jgi:hypothetical protein